ncbi:hypothetical protein GOP47_0024324 [Adiantum capillus-veneris]|uniref:UBC core domain-containing protein n=1 Tax=Adiantum capillus-veneris TaxID=13818 RepID=A0A9D4Z3K7_ADICA|nr:hypothetical protein GOP47_0024324 [Adiantum capillus-veneris]
MEGAADSSGLQRPTGCLLGRVACKGKSQEEAGVGGSGGVGHSRQRGVAGSGSVCLDVINQTWSPMSELVNVFEVFLPQLLLYPNPTDPLNGEAATLMMRDREQYGKKVREYCEKYAKPEDNNKAEDESSEGETSDDDVYMSSEEEVAGHADP